MQKEEGRAVIYLIVLVIIIISHLSGAGMLVLLQLSGKVGTIATYNEDACGDFVKQ